MKRKAAIFTILALMAVGLAGASFAAEYDRYERGSTRKAPAPSPRAATVAPPTHLNYGPGYIGGQLGFYSPNNEWDGLATYDTGFTINMLIGSRLTPFFAVEGSLGYFSSRSSVYQGDLSVVPMTIGGRFIVPNPVVEPYIGAGVGVYFTSLDEDFGVNDDSTDFGGYMSIGLDFWLSPRIALNMEGRYQWVESRFSGFDVDLSGWNMFFGVRIPF